jgi:hypothetical protein
MPLMVARAHWFLNYTLLYYDIGNSAFHNCYGFNGSLIISSSVTTISGSAFAYCSGFTSAVTFPNSVISLGTNSFAPTDVTGSLVAAAAP